MERGSRRLLNDLHTLGRLYDARLSASERLQREIGRAMMDKLFSADGGRPSAGTAGRRRRVA
jgi:hypothetical protein